MKLEKLFEWSADRYGSNGSKQCTVFLKTDANGIKAKAVYKIAYRYMQSEGDVYNETLTFYQVGDDAPITVQFIWDNPNNYGAKEINIAEIKKMLMSFEFHDIFDAMVNCKGRFDPYKGKLYKNYFDLEKLSSIKQKSLSAKELDIANEKALKIIKDAM